MPLPHSRAGRLLAAMSKTGARAKAHLKSYAGGRVFSNWRGMLRGQTRLPQTCARHETDSEEEMLLGGLEASDEDADGQEISDSDLYRRCIGGIA